APPTSSIYTLSLHDALPILALQLYYKENLSVVKQKTKTLFDALLELADTYKDKVLPGYTHLQVAMPSSFGLWFSAYAEVLIDDRSEEHTSELQSRENLVCRL